MSMRCTLALAAALLLAASFASPGFAAGSADFAATVKNMPAQSDKFRSMMSNLSVAQFHFVNVAGEADPAMLKKNAAAIADLRDTLDHATLLDNQGIVVPLRKVLQSKNLTVDNIVGISVAGSQITLYYQ